MELRPTLVPLLSVHDLLCSTCTFLKTSLPQGIRLLVELRKPICRCYAESILRSVINSDGPGAFDFTQGDNNTIQNPFWEVVKLVFYVLC